MKYVLLLYTEESGLPEHMSAEDRQAFQADFRVFNDALREKNTLVDAMRLRHEGTATTVRVSEDEALVTDGPFAETKESLGGLFVLECADLDEALEWAKRIPSARIGSVEVRPIWEDYGRPESS